MALTEEQRLKNNQAKRDARLKKKEQKTEEPQSEEPQTEEPQSEEPQTEEPQSEEPEPEPEDPEIKRKKDIADKRRITLAKAREKIRDRNDVKKENTDKIKLLQDENIKLKELSKVKKELPPPSEKKKHKPKKYISESESESESEEEQPQRRRENKKNNLLYLTKQTYAERLKKQLNDNMMNTLMRNTFN
jgi:pyruvate/2-oxoglutarate dehydrogenase complex dihydrolipoamide acyltransferase (E2) component